ASPTRGSSDLSDDAGVDATGGLRCADGGLLRLASRYPLARTALAGGARSGCHLHRRHDDECAAVQYRSAARDAERHSGHGAVGAGAGAGRRGPPLQGILHAPAVVWGGVVGEWSGAVFPRPRSRSFADEQLWLRHADAADRAAVLGLV